MVATILDTPRSFAERRCLAVDPHRLGEGRSCDPNGHQGSGRLSLAERVEMAKSQASTPGKALQGLGPGFPGPPPVLPGPHTRVDGRPGTCISSGDTLRCFSRIGKVWGALCGAVPWVGKAT